MEIIKEGEFNSENNELLPQILNRIFSICKQDPSFQLKEELLISEETMESLQQKINRKKSLLEKSKSIQQDLQKRNEKLQNSNDELKATLLESLGSEI